MKCNLCPRKFNGYREKQEGVCRMPWDIYAARAALHMWEEPCISGENGSGAVFFTGCTCGAYSARITKLPLENVDIIFIYIIFIIFF